MATPVLMPVTIRNLTSSQTKRRDLTPDMHTIAVAQSKADGPRNVVVVCHPEQPGSTQYKHRISTKTSVTQDNQSSVAFTTLIFKQYYLR